MAFGWNKLENGFKVDHKLRNQIFFLTDTLSKHKRVHIQLKTDKEPLCKGIENCDNTQIIEQLTPAYKKKLCKNCARILMTLNPDDARDHTIQEAKKTVSRKSKKSTPKHKRLASYAKALNKTHEDFMQTLTEKNGPSKIEIPDEIGPEDHSLQSALQAANTVLSIVRKTAVMNLDKTLQEWKKQKPNSQNQFSLIQKTISLKELIQSIDQIKTFKI